MSKITEKQAIEIISKSGLIKRYSGYYIVLYKKVDEKTWKSFAKVASRGGFVNLEKLNEAIAQA